MTATEPEAETEVLAHIIFPGAKLNEVAAGLKTRVKAMCGAWVTGRSPADAPVCRLCFIAWRERSEPKNTDEGS